MIKEITDFKLIQDFYLANYEAPAYLMPNLEDPYKYFAFYQAEEIVAMVAVEQKFNQHLAFLWKAVVRKDLIHQGIGKKLSPELEKILYSQGTRKLLVYVYTTNYPSIFFCLKQGFEFEGKMVSNDGFQSNVYTLGKSLYNVEIKT